MVNKQHAQFSDENGNIFYLENETEDVLDPSGKPLSNGGDLSEASVTFTPDATRKLPQSGGRFKAFLGSIVKFLSDLTEVAFSGNYSDLEGKPTIPPLANNCTTTAAGYGLDARQGKVLMDKANQLSSEINNLMIIKKIVVLENGNFPGNNSSHIAFTVDIPDGYSIISISSYSSIWTIQTTIATTLDGGYEVAIHNISTNAYDASIYVIVGLLKTM